MQDVGVGYCEHSELNETELTVVIHLSAAGNTMRQNSLAALTGWERGRLSHVLSWMESQSLIARNRLKNGVEVVMQPAGKAIMTKSDVVLRDAISAHLSDPLGHDRVFAMLEALTSIIQRQVSSR